MRQTIRRGFTSQATVKRLSHEGRGIVSTQDKTTFLLNALPGETVHYTIDESHRQYLEGKALSVVEDPHSARISPNCAHFMVCGGCQLQHMAPEFQVSHKQAQVESMLTHMGQVTPKEWADPLLGPSFGYRRKARLGARYVHKKQKIVLGFREQNGRMLADIEHCKVLTPRMSALRGPLATLLASLEVAKQIPQVEMMHTDNALAIVIRHLVPLPQYDMRRIAAFAAQHDVMAFSQIKGPNSLKPIWPSEPSSLYITPAKGIQLHCGPLDFIQVNDQINQAMIKQAIDWLALTDTDKVLDLFCGLGNFTLPLAQVANQSFGVEGDAIMVERAKENAKRNGLAVQFEKLDLSEAHEQLPFMEQGINKILIDPPRSGAQAILPLIARYAPSHLLYVSCNPATLARDAGWLVNEGGYTLAKCGIMDMFPQTSHVETMALFIKQP